MKKAAVLILFLAGILNLNFLVKFVNVTLYFFEEEKSDMFAVGNGYYPPADDVFEEKNV